MFRILCKSAKNLSTRMYLLANDLGLIDMESLQSNEIGNVRRPPADIMETDEAMIVTLELPGVEKKDIEITAVNEDLSVSAKRFIGPEQGESAQKRERSYDLFKRSVKLPYSIKSEQAKAAFNNGLLTVTLPKENAIIRNRISIE
jgi:HSP20 family protein